MTSQEVASVITPTMQDQTMGDTTTDRPRRTLRRTLAVLAATAVLAVALWMLASELAPAVHSDNEVEQPTPSVVEERGVSAGLSDLHGHLNWVIWGSGDFDEDRWIATVDATVAELRDRGHRAKAEQVARTVDMIHEGRSMLAVHDHLEAIQLRWADLES